MTTSMARRRKVAMCAIVVLGLAAAPVAGESSAGTLTDSGRTSLTAALAARKSYVEIIAQARRDGLSCDAVVGFLCAQAENKPALVHEIVYVAAIGGCDGEALVTAALRAGAPLTTVVRAALAANLDSGAIRAGAVAAGVSPESIANAFAGITGSGLGVDPGVTVDGGRGAGTGGVPGYTGFGLGDSFGGAGGPSNPSPHKPSR